MRPTDDPQTCPDPGEPRLLHGFLDRAVREHAGRPAVDVPPGRGRAARRVLTYAELDRRAEAVAARLRDVVRGECVVAILVARGCADLYAAQIGVLRAGAAYVCLDPSFPDEHARFVLADAQAVALLADEAHLARAAALGVPPERVLDVTAVAEAGGAEAGGAPPPPWLGPSSLAYVIYTSGTTGRPKGVAIEHASVANLVGHDVAEFGLGPGDRVAQGSSPAYDSSVEETWLALAAGATAVVMDDDAARLGPDLPAWLRDEGVTVLCPTPTLLRATGCRDPERELPRLRLVYSGGEALPQDLADRWAPGRRFENGYGPTECTVTSLHGPVVPGTPVSIGRPLRGHAAWVLDASLAEVQGGEPGELCIGGAGLARGYVGRPELTAEKFPVHPRLGRIYRTGDLARREASGAFVCLGRIDAQVKVRGHRIELEAVEAVLAQCDGVREAACRVQGDGADDAPCLAAHVVPADPAAPPSAEALRAELARRLPPAMVPDRIAVTASLPRTTGGKLDRRALPRVEAPRAARDAPAPPRDAFERRVAEAFRVALSLADAPPTGADFFVDLGGNSLRAAVAVSELRRDASTASVTVRDLYEARTAAAVAALVRGRGATPDLPPAAAAPVAGARPRPVLATLAQAAFLGAAGSVAAITAWALLVHVVPPVVAALGPVLLVVAWPALSLAATVARAAAALAATVAAKRVLIGRYRPGRVAVWSGPWLRHWMVRRVASLVPWEFLRGTVFLNAALRALGARIGRGVHVHRGVDLARGGWDLLEIGDDATVGEDASLRTVELDDGHLVVGPVRLGEGCTVDVRAGVSAHSEIGAGAWLTPLSWLPPGARVPPGERWDGIPARPAGAAPGVPPVPRGGREVGPVMHGVLTIVARHVRGTAPLTLAVAAVGLVAAEGFGVDARAVAAWAANPSLTASGVGGALAAVLAVGPLATLLSALLVRAAPTVRPGVVSRRSLAYVLVLAKTDAVRSAGEALSGTLFWPVWLRIAGMRIGRDCEVSTISDVVPELVEIGEESFLADGIYLGGPLLRGGTATLGRTRLGRGTFLGNHVVVPAGTALPDDVLLGVSTVADAACVRAGTDWFGHPPMRLPRREVVAADRRLTHDPTLVRRATRIVWEAARVVLPAGPALALAAWWTGLAAAAAALPPAALVLVAVPGAGLAAAVVPCLVVLAMKWALLGRVRPGAHPLWSCWCSRWDFHYVAWQVWARPFLAHLEGTLLLAPYLRAMGSSIGRRAVLGDGFAHVVDPDMLRIGDGATVACLFQAHSFEDRVLKIDHVEIGPGASAGTGAVLFYGARIGEGARVAPHAVVMKHEHLAAGGSYAGSPVVPVGAAPRQGGGPA